MSSFYGNGGYSSGGGGGSGEVISVNGKKGRVTLNAADVHALPEDTLIPSLEGFATEAWVNNQDFLTDENTYLIKIIKEFQVDLGGSEIWTYVEDYSTGKIHEATGFWNVYYDTNYYINKGWEGKASLTQSEIAERIFNQIGQKIPVIELTFKAPVAQTTQTAIVYYRCFEKLLSQGILFFVGPYLSGGAFIDFSYNSKSIILSSDGNIDNGQSSTPSYIELKIDSELDYYMSLSSAEKTTILEQMDQEEQDFLSMILRNYIRVIKEAFVNSIIPVLIRENDGAEKVYFWPIRNSGYNRFYFIGRVYESYSSGEPINIQPWPGAQESPSESLLQGTSASTLYKWVDYIITIDSTDISLEVIDTLPSGGTEGQVLTIDANGNPKWDNTSFVKVTDDGQGNVSMETLYGVLIDAVPTQNSNNLVISGGIYNAINNIANSSDLLSITVTYNESLDQYTANKTFAEINTAVNNGKLPILIYDIGDVYKEQYFLSDLGADYFSFYNVIPHNMPQNYKNFYFQIASDNTVIFGQIPIPNPSNYYTKTEIDTQIGNIETLLAQI